MELLPGERVLWSGHPAWTAQIGFIAKWGTLALIPALLAAFAPMPGSTGRWVGLSIVLVMLVVAVAGLLRARTFYAATTERVVVRRGILSRHLQSTPSGRVQNINLDQTLLDRMLNIGAIDFDTAGTQEGAHDFRFGGVEDPRGVMQTVARHMHREGERERP
jgi:uncharacterized membrane protein YdbT with pleckstrin-like domain